MKLHHSKSSTIFLLLFFHCKIFSTFGFVSNSNNRHLLHNFSFGFVVAQNENFCMVSTSTNTNKREMTLPKKIKTKVTMSSSNSNSSTSTNDKKGFGQSLRQLFGKMATTTTTATANTKVDQPILIADTIPQIQVRPRPLVSLDETTGKYVPAATAKPLPQQKQQQQQQQLTQKVQSSNKFTSSSFSSWNSIKDVLYNSIDSVSSISKDLKRSSKNNSNKRTLAVAYSDTVECKARDDIPGTTSIISSSSIHPKTDTSTTTTNTMQITPATQVLVKQYESSLAASSSNDRSNGEDYYRTNTRKSFDAAKDGLYDFFNAMKKKDDLTSSSSSTISDTKTSPIQNLKHSQADDATSFKPVAKVSNNKDETVAIITPYLADLNSSNPVKVIKAKYTISLAELKRNRRIQEQKRRETIHGIKQKVFTVVDAIQVFYNMILNLPKTIEDTIVSIEETIEQTTIQTAQTAKDIQQIPSKIQQAITDAKKSVDDTQKATLEVVNEVKRIPQKIEQSVVDTKQSINNTKESVENFFHTVEDMTFEAKVMVGLEKPKPKPLPPPPPPPPPKTNSEIAMDVAGVIVKMTGKAAFAVGKGAIGLTAFAAKAAVNAAMAPKEKNSELVENSDKKAVVEGKRVSLLSKLSNNQKLANPQATPTAIKGESNPIQSVELVSPTTIGDIDALLEKEVAEALRSAEEALESARKEQSNPSSKLSSFEINEALAKARIAAAQARKDAEELEMMLQKKNEYLMKS